MRRGQWFWGIAFIIAGALFLLESLGYLGGVSAWGLIWPLVLIILGLSALYAAFFGRRATMTEHYAVPLEGAQRAKLSLHYGAGKLRLGAGAGVGEMLDGSFRGGILVQSKLEGDVLAIDMHHPARFGFSSPWNWGPGGALDWTVKLNDNIPLELSMDTGACDAVLDLRELQVTDLSVNTGASSTTIQMPGKVDYTKAYIKSGAASMIVVLPAHVAAHIQVEGALAGVQVDTTRFERSGKIYRSTNYEAANCKAEIVIEASVGSLVVR
jgi:hypothetical protein